MKIIYQAPDGYTISADPTTGRALLGAGAKAAEVYLIAPAAILPKTAAALRKMKLDPANYRQIGPQVLRVEAVEAWTQAMAERAAYLAAAEATKTANIPGLADLRKAADEYDRVWAANRRAIERGDCPPDTRPAAAALDATAAKFPRAAAYLRAEAYSQAHNDRKASAGARAMRLLEQGGGGVEDADAILKGWLDGVDVD